MAYDPSMSLEEKRAYAREKMKSMSLDEKRALARSIMAGQGATAQTGGEVIQEMHPDIAVSDRLAIKNFGGDPATAVSYLQKKYGDKLQVGLRNDQIIAKRPDEKEWRTLDPEQGFLGSLTSPLETARDVGDIGYDIAAGIGSGAATAAGGLAGVPTGPGALATAATAGGVSSAVLEALRQSIGQSLGVHGDYKGSDIAIAGGLGAVSPLLFGTGASAAQIAKTAAKPGAAKALLTKAGQEVGETLGTAETKAAADIVREAQRGLIGKSLPKATQAATGVQANTIKSAGRTMPARLAEITGTEPGETFLQAANKIEASGVWPVVQRLTDDIKGALLQNKDTEQQAIGAALDASNELIDASSVLAPFADVVEKYSDKNASDAQREIAASVNRIIGRYFHRTVETVGPDGKAVIKSVPIYKQMTASEAMRLRSNLRDLSKHFADQEGKDIGTSEIIGAAKRAWPVLGDKLYDVLNQVDKAAGGKGNLSGRYRRIMEAERLIDQYFDTPDKAFRTIRTLNNKTKRVVKDRLTEFDREYGTKIRDASDLLDVVSVFGDPALDAVSGIGSTSTTRTMGLAGLFGSAGALAGHALAGPPGGIAGGGVGAFLGTKIGSPATVKKVLEAQQAASRAGRGMTQATIDRLNKMQPGAGDITAQGLSYLRGGAPVAAWNLMKRGQ